MNAVATQGLALYCDADGTVQQWLRDDLGVDAQAGEPLNLIRLLHDSSHAKGLSFLARLRDGVPLVDWELCLSVGGRPRVLRVAGSPTESGVIVVAAGSQGALVALCRELSASHPELCAACPNMTPAAQLAAAPVPQDDSYEELMRLYNDLARLQREHAKQHAELARLSADRQRMAGMAVHDLRSPLSVVVLLARSLHEQAEDRLTPDERDMLSNIATMAGEMGDSLSDLLERMRDTPRPPTLCFETDDLAALVRTRIELLGPLATRKQIRLDCHCDPDLPPLQMDAGRLSHVVDNLVGNAVKFSPTGTRIEIALRAAPGGQQLTVRDQGPGIASADAERIFDAFARGTATPTGGESSTGLGLAICRDIVKAHGGRIHAGNHPDGGALFQVFLPTDAAPLPA